MPQDFYTLEEAARRLGVSDEQLLDMAKPGGSGQPPEVRSFMDRGAPRFRKNEIEEVARRRGLGSDADVPLGGERGSHDVPPTEEVATEVFPFELAPEEREPEEETDIFSGLGSQAGPQGSESEVRLIVEGSDLALQPMAGDSVAHGPSDSGAKIGKHSDESSVQLGREYERTPSDSDINLGAPIGGGPKSGKLPPDSGVRLVEDWLVAKEQIAQSGLSGLGLTKTTGPKSTPQAPKSTPPGPKSTPPAGPKSAPKVTPFSLAPDAHKSGPKPPAAPPKKADEGSSEFELTPLADFEPSDSVFDPSSAEHAAVEGKAQPKTGKGAESDEESISFELAPEPESTSDTQRRKAAAKSAEKAKPAAKDDSSEFDLTPLKEAADSSSEFELTLEDEEGAPPVESAKTKAISGGKKGSDVDLEPLEEEDTSVEGSDFELALEEEPEGGEGDTGSDVVVIDEEAGEAAGGEVELEEEGEEMVVESAEEEEEPAVAAVMAPPVEWGWWGLIHLPTTLVLLFTGFLLLEMMRSIWSYNAPSNALSGAVFDMINKMFK